MVRIVRTRRSMRSSQLHPEPHTISNSTTSRDPFLIWEA
jgi:hypothetical protein